MADKVETASRDLLSTELALKPLVKLSKVTTTDHQMRSVKLQIGKVIKNSGYRKDLSSTSSLIKNAQTLFMTYLKNDHVVHISDRRAEDMFQDSLTELRRVLCSEDTELAREVAVGTIKDAKTMFQSGTESDKLVLKDLDKIQKELDRRFANGVEILSEDFWKCVRNQI